MTYKNRNIFPEESFLAAFLKKKKVNVGFPLAGILRRDRKRMGNGAADSIKRELSFSVWKLKLQDQSHDPANVTHLIKTRNRRNRN